MTDGTSTPAVLNSSFHWKLKPGGSTMTTRPPEAITQRASSAAIRVLPMPTSSASTIPLFTIWWAMTSRLLHWPSLRRDFAPLPSTSARSMDCCSRLVWFKSRATSAHPANFFLLIVLLRSVLPGLHPTRLERRAGPVHNAHLHRCVPSRRSLAGRAFPTMG